MSGCLAQLPPPLKDKTGWPWTEATDPRLYQTRADWPTITIVTPSYNQGQFIEATIRSVLLQNYPNLEYFIMDGGSTDETVEIIKRYEPWITGWVSEPDNGQSHAINKGMKLATGQLLNWLNSDDYLVKEGLFRLAAQLNEVSLSPALYCGYCEIADEFGNRLGQKRLKAMTRAYLLSVRHFPQPATFFNQAYITAHPIDEALHFAMDFRFYLEGYLKNAPVHFINDYLACSREYAQTKTRTGGKKLRNERLGVARLLRQRDLLDAEEFLFLKKNILIKNKKTGIFSKVYHLFR